MTKISLKELKALIREAIEENMEEVSGGINVGGGGGRGYAGGLPGGGQQRMGAMTVPQEKPDSPEVLKAKLEAAVDKMVHGEPLNAAEQALIQKGLRGQLAESLRRVPRRRPAKKA